MSDSDIQCPVCGYYCLGKGGHGCINKPALVSTTCNNEWISVMEVNDEDC